MFYGKIINIHVRHTSERSEVDTDRSGFGKYFYITRNK